MKQYLVLFVFFCGLSSLFASEVTSLDKKSSRVNAARVVELVKLVDKSDIKVNLVVHDMGGSTDVSPTQELFFTLYVKGEMFSTDATFPLGAVFAFQSATRLSGGIYEVKVSGVDVETSMPVDKVLKIDAQKAILAIKKVKCEDFDCPASENFESHIDVTTL